jgi:hypothetical protein
MGQSIGAYPIQRVSDPRPSGRGEGFRQLPALGAFILLFGEDHGMSCRPRMLTKQVADPMVRNCRNAPLAQTSRPHCEIPVSGEQIAWPDTESKVSVTPTCSGGTITMASARVTEDQCYRARDRRR